MHSQIQRFSWRCVWRSTYRAVMPSWCQFWELWLRPSSSSSSPASCSSWSWNDLHWLMSFYSMIWLNGIIEFVPCSKTGGRSKKRSSTSASPKSNKNSTRSCSPKIFQRGTLGSLLMNASARLLINKKPQCLSKPRKWCFNPNKHAPVSKKKQIKYKSLPSNRGKTLCHQTWRLLRV